MTSDEARKVAEETAATIVERAWRTVTDRSEANIASILVRDLTTALLSAARVPEGCVREGVTDRKVLGSLPVTADGAVAFPQISIVYHPDHEGGMYVEVVGDASSGHVVGTIGVPNPDYSMTWYEYDIYNCYSTRDAALAARKEGAKDE